MYGNIVEPTLTKQLKSKLITKYNNQDSTALAKKWTYRSMKQTTVSNNRFTHIYWIDFYSEKGARIIDWGKVVFKTNGAGSIQYSCKRWTLSHILHHI